MNMGGVLACSFRRLHIVPFTEELEDRIIAPALKPFASNISFHSKQTFPDRGYGYVDLPEMEAEKLKKKFNGATLKGTKVRIEDAKPPKKRKSDEEDDGGKAKKVLRRDKLKREDGVLPGRELEEGRQVKRGWTDRKEDSKASKSKRKQSANQEAQEPTEAKKLRFKTSVPPNIATPAGFKARKEKQGKEGESARKVVVEEFKKTKNYLVTSGGDDDGQHGELTYEGGQGWVDQAGKVVEPERPSKRPRRGTASKQPEPSVGAIESTETNEPVIVQDMAVDAEDIEQSQLREDAAEVADTEAEPAKEVHPLEALFKRPISAPSTSTRSRPKPIDTSFSFFDANAGSEDADMDGAVPPKTPNTKRDLEWRSIRSAAPTPDTAAIGRKFSFPFAGDKDEDEESDEGDDAEMEDANQAETVPSKTSDQGPGEESAFRKWFYEHRGEFNRGWKKRRREEKKAMRQRDNRRLRSRVA